MSPNDEIERLSRSLKSLEPIRLHEEISRVTELSRLASTRIAEVVRVNQQHWQHMIDQTTAVSRMTDLPYSAYPLYSSDESSYPWTRAVGGEDRVC